MKEIIEPKLSLYEVSRWYALIDAVNVISEKCEDSGEDFEKVELKPLEILKYVEVVSDTVYNKLSEGGVL